MLLGQPVVPGYEFRYMQIVYAGVMLVPLLHLLALLTTFRRMRSLQMSGQRLTQWQAARFIALPLIWNALLAYLLLILLPIAFGADLPAILLFQPDVGWVAIISGTFAIAWGVVSTVMGISILRSPKRLSLSRRH